VPSESDDSARANDETSVAIVGGGVVGTATALRLAERDVDVTVYEAGDVAGGATGLAAGICYDAYAEPVDADLAAESVDEYRDRGAITDSPYVWVAREGDDRNAEAIREQVPRMQAHDRAVEFVEPSELGARWPALRTDDVAEAAVARNAGLLEPGSFTRETAQFAISAGATVRTDTPVSVDEDGGVDGEAYDATIVAAGAHTGPLLSDAGHPLAVDAYRVQAYHTAETPLADRVPTLYDATGGYYLRRRDEGLLVGDGTVTEPQDPDDWTRSADGWFRRDCTDHLETAVGAAPGERRAWAGLCTATPDGDPLVGERAPGLYVATGFQGHGVMFAPAVADRLADQVLGGDGIDAYAPARFDGDESFEIVEGMTLSGS
jgi:sarcosine oxidase subunit beta